MMEYDFDRVIDRRHTDAVKTDSLAAHFGREDLIPLWVADMDFESPACVRKALQSVVDRGLYGYNRVPESYYPSIIHWLAEEQQWEVKREWLTFIPGIVKGIGYAVNYFTKPGDAVIVQPPVYPPFLNVPLGNGRELLYNPLIRSEEPGMPFYRMDFDGLEEAASRKESRLLILSNPHNPGGLCWDLKTLTRLAEICRKHGVLVVSDEIHADMPLFGHRHIPFASVSEAARENSITFGAPSKTFNMAGIVSSYAVVPNPEIRERFFRWLSVNELNSPTIFATLGAAAAYSEGNEWRRAMLRYIEQNIIFVEEWCKARFRYRIRPLRPEASFLIWLDCRVLCRELLRAAGADENDGERGQRLLTDLFVNRFRLALNDGGTFGPGGCGYLRLNVGTSRRVLEEALGRIVLPEMSPVPETRKRDE